MKILIAGCGDVGTLLGQLLVNQGHQVFGLKRNIDTLPPTIIPIAADLCQPNSLQIIPSKLDLLFYTASANQRSEKGYRQIYVDGLVNVLTHCRSNSPQLRHVFYTSSTSVYGQIDGSVVNEESQTKPTNFTGQVILEGESQLAQYPVPSSAIRFSGIYGPRRIHLIKNLMNGTATLKESDVFTNRIHRDDCAGFLAHMVGVDKPLSTYIATDNHPAPYNEVLSFIANQLRLTPPQKTAGTSFSNKRCSNKRLLESGYVLQYPSYQMGYKTLIDSFQN